MGSPFHKALSSTQCSRWTECVTEDCHIMSDQETEKRTGTRPDPVAVLVAIKISARWPISTNQDLPSKDSEASKTSATGWGART